MNYGLVDSLMKEFEQRNSLMIPGDLRRKVNMFVSLLFLCSHVPHLYRQLLVLESSYFYFRSHSKRLQKCSHGYHS